MATIIDPETAVGGLGGPLGWWRHTENLYKLVEAYRPKFVQSPMSTPFLRDKTLKLCTRVECAPAEPFTNEWVLFIDLWLARYSSVFCIFLDLWS